MIIGLLGQSGVGKDTAGEIIAAELGGVTLGFADPIKRFLKSVLHLRDEQIWGSLKQKETPISKAQLRALEKKPKGPLRIVTTLPTPWADALADACCVAQHDKRQLGRLWTQRAWYVNHDVDTALQQWWISLKTEKGLTPRRVMQHFGTECVRKVLGENFWIDVAFEVIDALLKGGHRYSRYAGLIPNANVNVHAAVVTDVRFRNEVLRLKRRGGEVYSITRPPTFTLHPKSQTDVKVKMGKRVIHLHASEQEQLSVPQFWLNGRFINRYETAKEFEETVRYVARNWSWRGPVVY